MVGGRERDTAESQIRVEGKERAFAWEIVVCRIQGGWGLISRKVSLIRLGESKSG